MKIRGDAWKECSTESGYSKCSVVDIHYHSNNLAPKPYTLSNCISTAPFTFPHLHAFLNTFPFGGGWPLLHPQSTVPQVRIPPILPGSAQMLTALGSFLHVPGDPVPVWVCRLLISTTEVPVLSASRPWTPGEQGVLFISPAPRTACSIRLLHGFWKHDSAY